MLGAIDKWFRLIMLITFALLAGLALQENKQLKQINIQCTAQIDSITSVRRDEIASLTSIIAGMKLPYSGGLENKHE